MISWEGPLCVKINKSLKISNNMTFLCQDTIQLKMSCEITYIINSKLKNQDV